MQRVEVHSDIGMFNRTRSIALARSPSPISVQLQHHKATLARRAMNNPLPQLNVGQLMQDRPLFFLQNARHKDEGRHP